jgi:hypothetical protein
MKFDVGVAEKKVVLENLSFVKIIWRKWISAPIYSTWLESD